MSYLATYVVAIITIAYYSKLQLPEFSSSRVLRVIFFDQDNGVVVYYDAKIDRIVLVPIMSPTAAQKHVEDVKPNTADFVWLSSLNLKGLHSHDLSGWGDIQNIAAFYYKTTFLFTQLPTLKKLTKLADDESSSWFNPFAPPTWRSILDKQPIFLCDAWGKKFSGMMKCGVVVKCKHQDYKLYNMMLSVNKKSTPIPFFPLSVNYHDVKEIKDKLSLCIGNREVTVQFCQEYLPSKPDAHIDTIMADKNEDDLTNIARSVIMHQARAAADGNNSELVFMSWGDVRNKEIQQHKATEDGLIPVKLYMVKEEFQQVSLTNHHLEKSPTGGVDNPYLDFPTNSQVMQYAQQVCSKERNSPLNTLVESFFITHEKLLTQTDHIWLKALGISTTIIEQNATDNKGYYLTLVALLVNLRDKWYYNTTIGKLFPNFFVKF